MGLPHLNIPTWIEENKKFFLPPVCNKMMHGEGQLKVFYVGGPNTRKDFHLEEGEELFYMVKGDMNLIVQENGKFRDVIIKEGEVFLLPGRIPHSPQRSEDTVGLVIERERLKQETDCLRYFVGETTEILFERWFYCEDLGTQLGPVIKEYFASEQHKTGKPIPGDIRNDPPWIPDSETKLENPFCLKDWIQKNRTEIDRKGFKSLFGDSYQSAIRVLGKNLEETEEKDDFEVWIWQIEGSSTILLDNKEITLKTEDSFLVGSGKAFQHKRPEGSISMAVRMDPKRNKKLGSKN